MAILALTTNNKNQYRKYPFKQKSSLKADNGYYLSDDAIVNCSITSIYGKHRAFIKQIFYKDTQVRIAIASYLDNSLLGVFSGTLSGNFTRLVLTSYTPFVSGTLTVGNTQSIASIPSTLNFSKEASELEESTIFCYTPPAVTSVSDKLGNKLRGTVSFGTLINVSEVADYPAKTSRLAALNPDAVFNFNDHSSFLGNCPNPIIKNINGVTPYPADTGSPVNDNNIYIVGVNPIVFYGSPSPDPDETIEPGILGVSTSGVTLDSLCTLKHKLLPPVDISGFTDPVEGKNKYYSKPSLEANSQIYLAHPTASPERLASNFYSTLRPEYYYWPQFVKQEYFNYWALRGPSQPVVISTSPTQTSITIVVTAPVTTGVAPVDYYEYSVDDGVFISTSSTSTTIVIDGLSGSTTYIIKIRAVNAAGHVGMTSAAVEVTTL